MERGDVATLSPSNSAAKFFTLQRIWTSWALQISDRFIQGEHIGRNERCVAQEVDTTVLFK